MQYQQERQTLPKVVQESDYCDHPWFQPELHSSADDLSSTIWFISWESAKILLVKVMVWVTVPLIVMITDGNGNHHQANQCIQHFVKVKLKPHHTDAVYMHTCIKWC